MTIDIDAIRKLADAAAPGPWVAHHDGLVWAEDGLDPISGSIHLPNAEFIAAARTLVPQLCDEIDRLRAENADLNAARQRLLDRLHNATPVLVAAQQRADQAEDRATDLAKQVEQLKKQLAGSGKADGPWKAYVVQEGWTANLSDLADDDEIDIVIVRDTAAPDDEGWMFGTYKSDDVAFEARDVFVDGDGGTPAATIYARAQVMAAALNRAEVA
ncbi:hypothetical protein [Micromonospora tulbaghiae]|uniref:hypothetical protein n=1 Tax=Micromonospora tulbaghiae TaxID=479978 RepID=UPI00340A0F87